MKYLSIAAQSKKLMGSLSLTLLFISLSLQVLACSCRPPSPLTIEEFLNADLVFEGKIVKVETDKEGHMKTITFDITKNYKTPKRMTTVAITTAGSSAACGLTVEEGQAWYIWANKNEESGAYSAGICSRSLQMADDVSERYYKRYNSEVELINSLKAKRGKQRLELSSGTAEGKMKKGQRCGKWKYYDTSGTLTKTCRFKKGIEVSCVEAPAPTM